MNDALPGQDAEGTDAGEEPGALRETARRHRALVDTIPLGLVWLDAQGRVRSANPAALRILGLSLAQLQGLQPIEGRRRTIAEDGSDFPPERYPARVALRTGEPVRDVVIGITMPRRGDVWIRVSAQPLRVDGRIVEAYASLEDITEQVRLARELRQQASTDFLTGLANRRSFMERLEIEFQRIRRHPAHSSCVLAFDLDHFKRVNDTWGHAAGDAVLRHVALLMRRAVRRPDLLSRSGGEEFLLLLPDTAREAAVAMAERLRLRLRATPTPVGDTLIPVTISIGVSAISAADTAASQVLARADAALYEAKRAGRDAVRLAG
jgi:diguanylate cyclase (GGDEF)-like protein/PAS domain S-box-containing protein